MTPNTPVRVHMPSLPGAPTANGTVLAVHDGRALVEIAHPGERRLHWFIVATGRRTADRGEDAWWVEVVT